jgi:hypothetical protein
LRLRSRVPWLGPVLTASLVGALVFAAAPAAAVTIDLGSLLGNSGYEDGTTSQWTETKPNASYIDPVPVDPVIQPLDPCCNDGTLLPTLTAPAGDHFVGVLNTLDNDPKGKLAHDALDQTFLSGTTFQVLVWANRGKLLSDTNTNPNFPGSTPQVSVQLRGWGAGSLPTVNPANDNWSRSSVVNETLTFTDWGSNGAWASQLFTFTTTTVQLEYIALSINGQTNNHDQYVAWDIASVPEPGVGLFLAGIGALSLYARRRS